MSDETEVLIKAFYGASDLLITKIKAGGRSEILADEDFFDGIIATCRLIEFYLDEEA